MKKRIVVNVGVTETRLAVQEGNLLTELYVERARRRSIVGNIYKGVVTNVLPGMQAAFVEIGLSKDAFLYGGDYTANLEDDGSPLVEEDDPPDVDVGAETEADVDTRYVVAHAPIEEMLRKSQEILVQVSKESLGTKGARITSFISIPGRYIVYMPQARHVGVSRRIRDEAERERLRGIVKAAPAAGRRVHRAHRRGGQGRGGARRRHPVPEPSVDARSRSGFESARAPALLHEEMDLTFRVVRDLFSPEVEEFLVDDHASVRQVSCSSPPRWCRSSPTA